MLPSKSITPFLGIWYEKNRARLFSSHHFRKATVNEEKVLRASARLPSISQYSEKLPYVLLRVSSLVKALLDSLSNVTIRTPAY